MNKSYCRMRLAIILLVVNAVFALAQNTGVTTRVSVASDGTQGDFHVSNWPAISADGRYVAFESTSMNLVPGDTNFFTDIFVHDRAARETQRVSLTTGGEQTDADSLKPTISADGRFVAFESYARNLVPGGSSIYILHTYVHDRLTRQTRIVGVNSAGEPGNAGSSTPVISANGRYVALVSGSTNLVADDVNGFYDIFIHDLWTSETTLISRPVSRFGSHGGSISPALSADGRFVAFSSGASNLTRNPDINAQGDIFVHDRLIGETTRVSITTHGRPARSGSNRPAISDDGRYVAFDSFAENLERADMNEQPDIFVHDRVTKETTLVSRATNGAIGNSYSVFPSISSDGRYVAFHSDARNLVPDDTNGIGDVFVRDRWTGETKRVSVASDGTAGNWWSALGRVSATGRSIAFLSDAGNLVAGDTNFARDIFVHEFQGKANTTRASLPGGSGSSSALAPPATMATYCLPFFPW